MIELYQTTKIDFNILDYSNKVQWDNVIVKNFLNIINSTIKKNHIIMEINCIIYLIKLIMKLIFCYF